MSKLWILVFGATMETLSMVFFSTLFFPYSWTTSWDSPFCNIPP